MKAYQLSAPSGPNPQKLLPAQQRNGIVRVDLPDPPAPGPGQVIVRVRAASLNFRDLLLADNPGQRRPLVPLSDGAGEVTAVGASVTTVKPGDRVAGTFFQDWVSGPITARTHDSALGGALDGMLAEQVTLSQHGVVPLPDYLSFEEAATLPCAAVTVWNALVEQGGLRAGETVLLLGTGGVSLFGLQFAKKQGARVILTSSSDEKLARARALGADETINYRATPDWEKTVWALTSNGVDHVVEVGGAGTLDKSLAATRAGGTISLIGVLTGFEGQINPAPVLLKSLRVQGVYVGSRDMFARMLRALELHQTRPVIDRVFAFDEAPAAYAHLRSGAHMGKVVVRF